VFSLVKLACVWDSGLQRFVNADENQTSVLNLLGYGRTVEDAHPSDADGRGKESGRCFRFFDV
jgi:hypothetical protein